MVLCTFSIFEHISCISADMANSSDNSESKVIYPKLSYEIIGAAFEVANTIEYGLKESHYQKAYGEELERRNILYEREKSVPIQYKDKKVGRYQLDFVVEGKVVVETKVRASLGYPYIKQVMGYLRAGNYKLAIVIYFTRDGVKYRRVLNSKHT